ncbi:coiled-coil domain-containing protein 181 isoform X2 [Nelusetta ayraudi]|uniref:coiled-coil domain-containing protein 181 isoform X2 n=1 Tax=Nelusetta ayraudi TaxID=303726 RepID=UPI003F722B95
MSEAICTKPQVEYEDDFEKDLDWLISEEGRSEDQGPDYEDIEAEINKELEEDEKLKRAKKMAKNHKEIKRHQPEEVVEDEERWPSPMEPFEYDSDTDSPDQLSSMDPADVEEQTEEEKKYILEKIEQANRELLDQEPPHESRQRRLHFKDKLVDLVVPPLHFKRDGSSGSGDDGGTSSQEAEVSGKFSELKLSPRSGSGKAGLSSEGGQGVQEGKVLVEKDGKFDLVSLHEVESRGRLPPIANGEHGHHSPRLKEEASSSSRAHRSSASVFSSSSSSSRPRAQHLLPAPRPPAQPRNRPSSASHGRRGGQVNGVKRRVQSATGTTGQATYTLSAQQKELLQRVQRRKERLAREAEEKKHEEHEYRKQENELAFKAWLLRKREQLQEEKRIHRAQEMERSNCKGDSSDPQESFRLWLQRKQEQQQRERQLEEMKRLEQDSSYHIRSRDECERAFKLWLRRKRAEKRAEEQAALEQTRRLVLEERRARRMRDLQGAFSETQPFRFSEQLAYHF